MQEVSFCPRLTEFVDHSCSLEGGGGICGAGKKAQSKPKSKSQSELWTTGFVILAFVARPFNHKQAFPALLPKTKHSGSPKPASQPSWPPPSANLQGVACEQWHTHIESTSWVRVTYTGPKRHFLLACSLIFPAVFFLFLADTSQFRGTPSNRPLLRAGFE